MTLEALVSEIRALPVEDRKALIMVIVDTLTEPAPRRARSLKELRGLGKEIWQDIDVEDYINRQRDEWDSR